jgi:hypothetical protein
MKAYKGFNKDMTCRGFQYKEGGEYETDRAELCECGFHACEAPLKVWDFYPPVDGNRFCEVEQDGDVKNEGADGKSVSTKIKIGAEIGIPGLVKAHVDWCKKQTMDATKTADMTDKGGNYAKIGSSGYSAQIGSSGNYAKIGSSGDYAKIGSSGDYAKIGSSGDYAKIGLSGDYAKIGSSGNSAQIECTGKNAVVACAGANTIVKAPVGAWVCLSEYGEVDDEIICVGMRAFRIDGDKYKPDTWYALKGGKVVEVNE